MDAELLQHLLGHVEEILLHARLAAEAARQGDVAGAIQHALEAAGLAQHLS